MHLFAESTPGGPTKALPALPLIISFEKCQISCERLCCESNVCSNVVQDDTAQTDGTGKLRRSDGAVSSISIISLEGELDWGLGGGSNPVMQLCAYYALGFKNKWGSLVVAETLLPAVGLEIFGHGLR